MEGRVSGDRAVLGHRQSDRLAGKGDGSRRPTDRVLMPHESDWHVKSLDVPGGLADGQFVRGAALVGADGLWSNVRKQMIGDSARVSGHTTYRSVIPTEQMPEDLRWNAATLWAGPKCHIVHYPLSGWKVFNLVVTYHNDAPEPVAGKPVPVEEVRRGFGHVCERAQNIIRHGKDWHMWVLCDREPIKEWSKGRVTLLGDAAHPMLQYLAQGAGMALEDSLCLAKCLDETVRRRVGGIARPGDVVPLQQLRGQVFHD